MAGHDVWTTVALFLAALFLGIGWLLIKSLGRAVTSVGEWAAWLAVTAISLWAMRNFFYDGLIGSGDSYHYSLQIADFVTQFRSGIWPVLVGQSEYGFNGNVHTLRTAPYFTHLAGAIDLITVQRLSFYLLKNLVVILSAWGGATATYAAVRVLAPNLRWEAILVAILYLTAPGILAPLVSLDMYATFTTVPFLPLFLLGIALSLRHLDDTRPLLLSVASLAFIWYGHPPIAAWLSPLLIVTQGTRIILLGGAPGNLLRPIGGALLFLLLTGYLFFSVHSLRFPSTETRALTGRAAIAMNTRAAWPEAFLSLGESAAQQLKLGYALWACLGLSIFLFRRQLDRVAIGAFALVLLVLVLPVPGLTLWLWSIVPDEVINLTNNWPAQRFYPLLSAAVVIGLALVVSANNSFRGRKRFFLLGFLLCATVASFFQFQTLEKHSEKMRVANDLAGVWIQPENVTLTRSSYLLFNGRPGYYSDSWVDPEFESRLLDNDLNPLLSNAQALLELHANSLPPREKLTAESTLPLTLDRNKNWILDFSFSAPTQAGEIALTGAVRRAYFLPQSGDDLAFGSGPLASHTLNLRAHPGAEPLVNVLSTVSGISLRTFSYENRELPVAVLGLTPYRARVRSPHDGYLETPAVFLPGYTARVNGQTAQVRRSYQGLVTVAVSAGDNTVEVLYPGPFGLRGSWFLSLAGFISLPFFWWGLAKTKAGAIDASVIRRNNLLTLFRGLSPKKKSWAVLGLAGAAVLAFVTYRMFFSDSGNGTSGSVRLTLNLPRWNSKHSEPLVVTGHQGAADCLYLTYEDATHARIGYDHWGKGGPISAPFPVFRGPSQIVEITMGSLYPRQNAWFQKFQTWVAPETDIPLVVSVNGREVLNQMQPYFPSPPDEFAVGSNQVGSSTSEPTFTGEIVKVERFIPEFLQK